jgi:hypothetical protein
MVIIITKDIRNASQWRSTMSKLKSLSKLSSVTVLKTLDLNSVINPPEAL